MMRPFPLLMLLALFCLGPTVVLGQNKSKEEHLETTAQDYAALAKMKGVTGRIMSLDPAKNTLTFQVEIKVPEIPPGTRLPQMSGSSYSSGSSSSYYRPNMSWGGRVTSPQQMVQRYQQMMRQQMQQMMRMQQQQVRVAQQAMRQQQQYMQQLQSFLNSIRYKVFVKDFTVPMGEDVQVARKTLGLQYDDKGNVVTYTAEQLKKLRASDLPGYAAKMDEVRAGQVVYLYSGARDKTEVANQGKDDKGKTGEPGKAAPNMADKKGDDPLAALLGGDQGDKGGDPLADLIDPNKAAKAADKGKAGADVLGSILGTGDGGNTPGAVAAGAPRMPPVRGILILGEE
jgi:hypothetical protein